MKLLRGTVVAAFAMAFLVTSAATAGIVTFELSVEFSGSGWHPEGPPPWLIATFDDGGTPGTVTLTLTSRLVDDEFLGGSGTDTSAGGWYFNFAPGLGLDAGDIWQTGGPDAGWHVDEDGLKADGDGVYDLRFYWEDTSDRFGAGALATFDITHEGIIAQDFYYLSLPGGGNGTYPTAGHVQGFTDPDGSAWITIPAPGALILGAIGLGLVGIGGWAAKRRLS